MTNPLTSAYVKPDDSQSVQEKDIDSDEADEFLLVDRSNCINTPSVDPNEVDYSWLRPRTRRIPRLLQYSLIALVAFSLLLLSTPRLHSFGGNLRKTQVPNDFYWSSSDTCECGSSLDNFCKVYSGSRALQRSIIHEGTNVRVDRLLQKARHGKRLSLAIMGGSVSACHGVAEDHDMLSPACYGARILEWFQKALPVSGGHVMHNGAIGAMDSRYVSCYYLQTGLKLF